MLRSMRALILPSFFIFSATLSTTVFANDYIPTVYGKLNLALENIDDESKSDDFWDIKSHASRFGIKGKIPTDMGSLQAIYQLEWEVDVSDENLGSEDHLKSRNQYVGLQGNFGKFFLGRHDTPFKKSQGKIELFDDLDADIKIIMAGGENRENSIFQYSSPKISNVLTISVMGIPGEDPDSGNNSVADATSASIAFAGKRLYIAGAFDFDVEGDDTDAGRLTAIWHSGNFQIGGLIQTTDFGTDDNEEVGVLSGYYTINKTRIKLQFGSTSNYAGITDNDAELVATGLDYLLSQKTNLALYFITREGGDKLQTTQSKDTIGFGIVHKF